MRDLRNILFILLGLLVLFLGVYAVAIYSLFFDAPMETSGSYPTMPAKIGKMAAKRLMPPNYYHFTPTASSAGYEFIYDRKTKIMYGHYASR